MDYVVDVFAHQDFGTSYYTKQPVFDEIWPRYITTIKLALIGIILSTTYRCTARDNCGGKAIFAMGQYTVDYFIFPGGSAEFCPRHGAAVYFLSADESVAYI